MCTVQLVTADYFLFSQKCAENHIPIFGVETIDSLTYAFSVFQKDLEIVKDICSRQGCNIKAKRKRSITELAVRRPLLFSGILLLFILFLFLPTRVLFINVSGNESVPAQRILEAAENSGVFFLCSRKALRSEAVKNAILENIPELSWVGVNTRGCIAEIQVREHAERQESGKISEFPSIVAARDGIITGITLRSGVAVCQKGQAVQKDQELITSDHGRLISRPDGDIYAVTSRTLNTITPVFCMQREDFLERKRIYTLVIGKKRIKLYGDSRNQTAVCDRMYTEYCITLPGGFKIPAALEVDSYEECSLSHFEQNEESVKSALEICAGKTLGSSMIAGRILERSELFSKKNDYYMLYGRYLCSEMIGRPEQNQIGVKQGTWNES